ncbi:MAG: hypothetical protein C0598_13530 [Marinilabiliales bacterium]|nr:MAG: hypothetical protein C0598_13530 [Marinilabiliales bacterium]
MKKLIAIVSVIIIFGSLSFATNENPVLTTNVSGTVIDKNTGEALAGVKVILSELNETAYTDFDGNFEFKNVRTGEYTINTELISYEKKSVKVDLSAKSDLKIEVEN